MQDKNQKSEKEPMVNAFDCNVDFQSVDKELSDEGTIEEEGTNFLETVHNENLTNMDKIYNHNNVLLGGSIEEVIIDNRIKLTPHKQWLGMKVKTNKKKMDEGCCICFGTFSL